MTIETELMDSGNDFGYFAQTETTYKRLIHMDGVKTTICENRFDITVLPEADIGEQLAVQQLRDWIRWRKKRSVDELKPSVDN